VAATVAVPVTLAVFMTPAMSLTAAAPEGVNPLHLLALAGRALHVYPALPVAKGRLPLMPAVAALELSLSHIEIPPFDPDGLPFHQGSGDFGPGITQDAVKGGA